MADGMRLFIGAQVSVATANALARCAEALARRARDANVDVKWVRPENYHVTLKFLGWTHGDTVVAVHDHVAAALRGVKAFSFRTLRLGGFPSLDNASVIWAGVAPPSGRDHSGGPGASDPLVDLAARIDRATTALGFAAEQRPFHPHVTIGRVAKNCPVRDVVLPMSEQMFSDSAIDHVILFESSSKSSSYIYKEISRIRFKPAEIYEKRQMGAVELGEDTDDGWSEAASREQER